MKNTKVSTLLLSSLALLLSSCERPEGEGGKSAMEGQVYVVNDAGRVAQNANGEYYFVRDTLPAVAEDVYIIYGSDVNDFYGDKIKTDYRGRFRFDYLTSGTYIVYAYSSYASGEQKPEFRIEFLGHSGTTQVQDIYILSGKNVGQSAICGTINATGNYNGPAIDARVYLCELGVLGPTEDVRTDGEGRYLFTRLTPGRSYRIWSESLTKKNSVSTAVSDTVYIEAPSTIVKAKDLTVGIY